jgi:hypothetical protein
VLRDQYSDMRFLLPKNLPQTVRAGFDEFLKLDRRQSDSMVVRNRTMRTATMRRDTGLIAPGKGLSFSECGSARDLLSRTFPSILPSSGCPRRYDAPVQRKWGCGDRLSCSWLGITSAGRARRSRRRLRSRRGWRPSRGRWSDCCENPRRLCFHECCSHRGHCTLSELLLL